MAIFFTAARIKIMILYLFPNSFDLLTNRINIALCNKNFFLSVTLFFVRFDKIKFSAYHFPSFFLIIINQDLVKHSLSPIITSIRIFIGWWL